MITRIFITSIELFDYISQLLNISKIKKYKKKDTLNSKLPSVVCSFYLFFSSVTPFTDKVNVIEFGVFISGWSKLGFRLDRFIKFQ